jgi:hypothetical protein
VQDMPADGIVGLGLGLGLQGKPRVGLPPKHPTFYA